MTKSLNLFRKFSFGFSVLVAILLTLMAVAFVSFTQLAEANRWNLRTYQILVETHAIGESLSNMEAGARGLALTGDESFRSRLTKGQAEYAQRLNAAQSLIRDERAANLLRDLPIQRQQWERSYLEPMLATRPDAPNPVATLQKIRRISIQGKPQMDAMRSILESINDREAVLLRQRSRRADRLQAWTAAILLSGGLFAVALAGALSMLRSRNVRRLTSTNAQLAGEITERKQAEDELRASEERTRLIVDTAHDAYVAMDADSLITDWNHAAESIFGWSRAAVLGQPLHETIIPPQYREAHQRGLQHFLSTGEGPVLQKTIEITALHRDGHEFPVELTISPIRWQESFLFSAFIRDITERKQAAEQLAAAAGRVTNILESIAEAFIAVDKEWRFTYVNDEAERFLMRSGDELIGHSLWETFPEAVGTTFYDQYHQAVASGLPVTFEEFFPSLNVWFEVHAYPSAEGLSIYLQDVTGRKQAEIALQQAIKEAEQAKAEAERAQAEAERANAAKSEFLSRMSHELRTPLNAILGFGQLMEMDDLDEGHRQGVNQILKGGRHLLELVNEVLDIASIDAGRLALSSEPVQLSRLVQEAMQLVQPLAEERHIRFENNIGGGYVMADQQRLKQVLLNLLSNAVKYNREGGLVRLSCGPKGDRVRFEVTDTGPGIPPAGLEKLFLPFERLNAPERGVEGTGIGLTISQRLVQVMGGEIGVTSVEGEGSTFWVELPGAPDPVQSLKRSEAVAPIWEAAADGKEHTVLYIEDNLSNLNLIEHILARRGEVRLLSAMQGRRGLELAREHRPDLILLDLHLPDINGDEVLQHLRAEAETKDIPVVMLSADATPRQIERLLEAGAKDYLTKPLDVKRFLRVLDEELGDAKIRGSQS